MYLGKWIHAGDIIQCYGSLASRNLTVICGYDSLFSFVYNPIKMAPTSPSRPSVPDFDINDVDFNQHGYQMSGESNPRPDLVWTVGPGNTYPRGAAENLLLDAWGANERSHRGSDAKELRKSLVGAIRRAYGIDGNGDWQVVIDKGGSELMQSVLLGVSTYDPYFYSREQKYNEVGWDDLDQIGADSVLVVHNDVFSGEATQYLQDAWRSHAVLKMPSGEALMPGSDEVAKLVSLVKSGKVAAIHLTLNATTEGAMHSREVIKELREAADNSVSHTIIIGDNVSGQIVGITHDPKELAHVEYTSGQKQAGAGSSFGFAVVNTREVLPALENDHGQGRPFQGHRFSLLSHLKKGEFQRTTTPGMLVERVADGVLNALYREDGDTTFRDALEARRVAALWEFDSAMQKDGELGSLGYKHVAAEGVRSSTVRAVKLPEDLSGRAKELVGDMAKPDFRVTANTGYGKDPRVGLSRLRTGYFGWNDPDAVRAGIQKVAEITAKL